jgi:uncharacterized damage-inducible protein DinB
MTTTMRAVDPMIAELNQEAEATQRMLDRVPADKLTWKPHEKSMTLGQLALHVATVCGSVGNFLEMDGFAVEDADFNPEQPGSKDEIMQRFQEAQANAKAKLEALDNDGAMAEWTLTKGGDRVVSMPKIVLARSLMFNHLYHHRGQLSVYLRLLDIPVPATYGNSADENPLG